MAAVMQPKFFHSELTPYFEELAPYYRENLEEPMEKTVRKIDQEFGSQNPIFFNLNASQNSYPHCDGGSIEFVTNHRALATLLPLYTEGRASLAEAFAAAKKDHQAFIWTTARPDDLLVNYVYDQIKHRGKENSAAYGIQLEGKQGNWYHPLIPASPVKIVAPVVLPPPAPRAIKKDNGCVIN